MRTACCHLCESAHELSFPCFPGNNGLSDLPKCLHYAGILCASWPPNHLHVPTRPSTLKRTTTTRRMCSLAPSKGDRPQRRPQPTLAPPRYSASAFFRSTYCCRHHCRINQHLSTCLMPTLGRGFAEFWRVSHAVAVSSTPA